MHTQKNTWLKVMLKHLIKKENLIKLLAAFLPSPHRNIYQLWKKCY